MKYWNNFDYLTDLPTRKKAGNRRDKRSVTYYNVPCAFDIETTSTTIGGAKFAFMYEWTFGMIDKEHICYGRTWEEFLEFVGNLKREYNLDLEHRLVIYVHNLGFEFQFMWKYFQWYDVFAPEIRKPIKCVTTDGIEFRDSYILSGYGLSKLAENLVSHNIKKLVGDLDYSKVRTPSTPLTEEELAYCNNDVEILLYYIAEQIEQYKWVCNIPNTNTGRVRKYMRDRCLHSNTSHSKDSKGKRWKFIERMRECSLTLDEYNLLKQAFMGGFTHASMQYSGQTLKNVHSIDFTSSYPAVMLMEKFPMSRPIKVDLRREKLQSLIKSERWGCLFVVKFTGISAKNTFDSYLSESKCFQLVNPVINNGRIYQADSLVTVVTDVDYQIIRACYNIESQQVDKDKCYKFEMGYLPREICLGILELYKMKTELKGVKGKETEYLLAKGMTNSVYGMCVTAIIRNTPEFSNGWNTGDLTDELASDMINQNNENIERFLYYPWGVWVTAYARRNLWVGILNIGDDYIYSDTDSIKFLNYEKHKEFIDRYNKRVEEKLRAMCARQHIDFNLCKPKTKNGVEKLIGVWDYEGCYSRFKTLGAKRYIYEQDGELHITIAGLSKSNGVEYMLNACNGDKSKVFEMFTDELYIPAEYTGKMTHTYIDMEHTFLIIDYLGNKELVTSKSGIHLEPCDFTLSISRQYNEFLLGFKAGYIFAGRDKL